LIFMKHCLTPALLAAALCGSAIAQEPTATPPAKTEAPATAPSTPPVVTATPTPGAKVGKKSSSKSGPRLKYNPPEGSIPIVPPAPATPGVKAPKNPDPTGNVPALQALAPNHVALTIQEHPSLSWFQKRPSKSPLDITLTAANKTEPVMSYHLERSSKLGVLSVSLEDQKISLDPGVVYTWTVVLAVDPADHSKDVKSSGTLKRIAPPTGLEAKIAKADPAAKAIALAGAGLWYDALSALNTAIVANQEDTSLRDLRASLLKQGGFLEIGAAERP